MSLLLNPLKKGERASFTLPRFRLPFPLPARLSPCRLLGNRLFHCGVEMVRLAGQVQIPLRGRYLRVAQELHEGRHVHAGHDRAGRERLPAAMRAEIRGQSCLAAQRDKGPRVRSSCPGPSQRVEPDVIRGQRNILSQPL